MFSEYVNAEFTKRRMLQFKGCRRRASRNNCKRWLLLISQWKKIMVWSFRNITM